MRRIVAVALFLALAACRGEPVPRDYQNAPPDMTNPPRSETATPSGAASGQAPPQPSTGVEGTAGPYEPVQPDTNTTTIPDTPPTTTT